MSTLVAQPAVEVTASHTGLTFTEVEERTRVTIITGQKPLCATTDDDLMGAAAFGQARVGGAWVSIIAATVFNAGHTAAVHTKPPKGALHVELTATGHGSVIAGLLDAVLRRALMPVITLSDPFYTWAKHPHIPGRAALLMGQ